MAKMLLLCGWSVRPSFFDTFIERYFSQVDVEVHEVGLDAMEDFSAWLGALGERIDSETLIVGWSLGGMVSISLAAHLERESKPYAGLVTLMAAPVFVQKDGWECAMTQEDFASFRAQDVSDRSLIRVFSRILAAGFESTKQVLRTVNESYPQSLQSRPTRSQTLTLLSELNLSAELGQLKGRVVMVFADNDALVSGALVSQTMSAVPQHGFKLLSAHGHYPLTSKVSDVVHAVLQEVA